TFAEKLPGTEALTDTDQPGAHPARIGEVQRRGKGMALCERLTAGIRLLRARSGRYKISVCRIRPDRLRREHSLYRISIPLHAFAKPGGERFPKGHGPGDESR